MMKKGLIATTLAGTVLATGVLTGQAHAAEQKQSIYVFTEKQFNEHRTGETEGFGGGPGSDVGVVMGNETYQQYLQRVKEGQYNAEHSGLPIKYVYPKDAEQNNIQQPNQNNTNMNHQSSTPQTVANAQQQPEQSSQATVLPETGQQTSNSGVILSSILGVIGSAVLLISRKFKQQA
ncbi:cell wall protein [Staphylococcus warneri]|uniref:LPXTG cell wall anchor domain-containing protein n=2 Tax=Staphylococcus warneri TaxID=1292 RepID=UPI000DCD9292|nr:LPXTG cell wall anchor domain-containing protein [Staphylococcus warneri]RAV25513.1 cell wall protein [Staphylococcus warneri]RXU47656.1 cell wall protein [Staphylococcus warneri]